MTYEEWVEQKKKKKQAEETTPKASSYSDWVEKTRGIELDDIAPVKTTTSEEEEDKKWYDGYFQKSSVYDDGYQIGDLAKASNSTKTDILANLLTGVIGMGEKVVDFGAGLVPYLHTSNLFELLKGEKYFGDEYHESVEKMDEFIAKDLYDEENVAKTILGINWAEKHGVDIEGESVLGEKSDSLVQSAGQLAATAGLQAVGVPWWLTTGITAAGGEMEEALKEGATHTEALASSAIAAGAEILTERIGGIKFGGKTLSDSIVKPFTSKISNKLVKALLDVGIDAVGEGAEEYITEIFNTFGDSLYKEEDFLELMQSEEYAQNRIDSFVGGMALGGVFGSVNSITSNKPLTESEQKVVDKVYNDRLEYAEKENGKKLTSVEKEELYDDVVSDMDQGRISMDTIEEVLGGDTYKSYKDTIDSEEALKKELEDLNGMKTGDLTGVQSDRLAELKGMNLSDTSKRDGLKAQLRSEVYGITKGSRLGNSYTENFRKTQRFTADLSQYKGKAQEFVKSVVESGKLNDSKATHSYIDFLAKSADRLNTSIKLTNVQEMMENGQLVDQSMTLNADGTKTEYAIARNAVPGANFTVKVGDTVVNNYKVDYQNGTITFESAPQGEVTIEYQAAPNGWNTNKGEIVLNSDTKNYLTFVAGHEITHSLENTKHYAKLQKALFDYAKAKGVYDSRRAYVDATYTKQYAHDENYDKNIDKELTADLVGDYIFSDTEFLESIYKQDQNIFKQLWDSLKHLAKMATSGSTEARELEKVKMRFEQVWRDGAKDAKNGNLKQNGETQMSVEADDDVQYSLSDSDGKQLTKEQSEFFKDSKVRDENGNLKVMYHGSQDAGFHVFDSSMSDDGTSFFFVDRNDVAASYSGTSETYEARTINTAEDMNNFLAEIGYDHYEAVEKDGKFELLENNEHVAYSDTAKGLYEEFCWYEGVGDGDVNYKVYLNLKNPLVVDAKGKNWNNISREYSQEVADRYNALTAEEKAALSDLAEWGEYGIFKDEMLNAIEKINDDFLYETQNADENARLLSDAYKKLGGANANLYDAFSIASDNFSEESLRQFAMKQMKTRDYAQKAKAEGYDGVIFNNIVDNGGYSNGSEGASTVAIAFDSNQIKSVANAKPTSDPDIRFSLSESVEETKDLMALHNLTEQKLLKSLKLGGLPMPSVAIAKAKDGHSDFGEISLIMPRDTIDPETSRRNKIYSGDAWTPTYPQIEFKASDMVLRKVRDKISSLVPYDVQDVLGNLMLDSDNARDVLNRYDGNMVDAYKSNDAMKYAYLKDIGSGITLPSKEANLYRYGEASNEAVRYFSGKLINGLQTVEHYRAMSGRDMMRDKALTEAVADALNFDVLRTLEPGSEAYLEYEQNPLFHADDVAFRDVDEFLSASRKLFTKGIQQTVDRKAAKELIRDAVDQTAYENWLGELFDGIVEKEGIRNNKDTFTPSGNRRSFEALHYEHNLENVIKAMRENGEKGIGAFGGGNIFGASATEFSSVNEMKQASGRLQNLSEEEYDRIKKEFSTRFYELATSLPNTKNSFTATDDAANTMIEAISKYNTRNGIANYLKRELQGWATYREQAVDDLIELVNDIRNMPTGYFEAKPQRAVGLEEVGVFVIPNNADVKLKQELLNKGYSIAEYDPNVEGDRHRVVNQFEEYKFSLSDSTVTPTKGMGITGDDIRYTPDIAPVSKTETTVAKNAPVAPVMDDEPVAPIATKDVRGWRELANTLVEAQTDEEYNANNRIYDAVEVMSLNEIISDVESGMSSKDLYAKSAQAMQEYQDLQASKGDKSYTESEMLTLTTLYNRYTMYQSVAQNPAFVEEYKKALSEYEDSNMFPDDPTLPAEDSEDRMLSLDDADAPVWMDDSSPEPTEAEKPADPFEERDWKEVGNRKTKAYMYENPEVKPYFQEAAQAMLGDLQNSVKGERWYNDEVYYDSGGEYGWGGTERVTTDDIAYLLDEGHYTYEQIEKGLKAIIEDDGAENNACSKRIEFLLNDRLRDGYTDVNGYDIPPSQEYLDMLEAKQVSEYSEESWNNLIAQENNTAPVAEPPVAEHPVEEMEKQEAKPESKTANIVYDEMPQRKKLSAWKWAKEHILSHGAVFEDLSLETGNRELQARFDSIRRAESMAQHFIGKGKNNVSALKDVRSAVESSGKTKSFNEYMYHLHNIDRMSLETEENRVLREGLKEKLKGYSDKQIEKLALEWIRKDTPKDHVQKIKDARAYVDSLKEKNKPVFGDSVTADVSKGIVAELEAENPEFKEYAEEIYGINRYLREMLVENGVISRETADLWEKIYPHYVPIHRVNKNGQNINVPLDTNRTGVNAPIKRAEGGNSDFYDLFRTMAERVEQTYKAVTKNRFGVELKNTLGTTLESESVGLDEVLDSMDQHEELLKKGENGENPTFTVFEDGKRVTFEITDEMYEALKPSQFTYTNKTLNKINNARRNVLTTWSPTFMLTNPIKDVQDILMNSQHPAHTYKAIPKAIKEIMTKGQWYQERMENGGDMDSYFDGQSKEFVGDKTGIQKFLGKLQYANEVIEQIPRLAEYIASREMGRSIDVSMLDAARVTTNFGASGDFTNMLNRNGATFLSASVEGFNQQVRNIREAKAQGLKGWAALAGKTIAAGLPAMLLNHLLWDDDEEYEELSDYVKQNYYIVGKFGDGKFVRIPKGRTVAVIQDAFKQMENLITGDDEVDLMAFADLVKTNLAPNNVFDNWIGAPITQAIGNKAWYGGDLVPTRLQDLPAGEQFDETTDSISKWLGETTNTSPYKWNYILDQYSGGVGDILLPYLTPSADGGGLGAAMRDKFTTDSTLKNQSVTDFYDTNDKLAVNANSMYASDEDVLMSKYMNTINSKMGELYGQKREVQNSNLSDKEKNAQVRELQSQINALAREGLNTYGSVKIDNGYATVGDVHYRKNKGEWTKITDDQLDKQIAVTSDLGISPSEYWSDKNEYDFMYEYPEKHEFFSNNGISYDDYADADEDGKRAYNWAYENPGKYTMSKAFSDDFLTYYGYRKELNAIEGDKDANGETVSGSKKTKVINYINNMYLDYGQKFILFRSMYSDKEDRANYNADIVEYLNSRDDISYEEMVTILEELDMKVSSDGSVTWD